MKIAITDACIFIDLHELKLTNHLFSLELDIHTSLDVFNELYPHQQDVLSAFHSVGKLTIHNISAEDKRHLAPKEKQVVFLLFLSNTNRKAGSNVNLPIDTDEFIRQVTFACKRENMTKSVQTDSQTEIQNDTPEPAEEKPTKRKRGQMIDYESLFLSRNELRERQSLYIGKDNYETLQTLVRSILGERLSVSGLWVRKGSIKFPDYTQTDKNF